MPRLKSVLKNVKIQVAKRKRRCKHSKTEIPKGEPCLVVVDPGVSSGPSYCGDVAMRMIEQARAELDRLEERLSGTS